MPPPATLGRRGEAGEISAPLEAGLLETEPSGPTGLPPPGSPAATFLPSCLPPPSVGLRHRDQADHSLEGSCFWAPGCGPLTCFSLLTVPDLGLFQVQKLGKSPVPALLAPFLSLGKLQAAPGCGEAGALMRPNRSYAEPRCVYSEVGPTDDTSWQLCLELRASLGAL